MATAQLLEGRNKLKTVEEKTEKRGFSLRKKKGKTAPPQQASRRGRQIKPRTTSQQWSRVKQGANYNTTGGRVSIDNTPKAAPRYSVPNKPPKRKTQTKTRSKSSKVNKNSGRVPMIRFSPKIGLYNPNSPNPRYSKNPGFDATKRTAVSPRYSQPASPVTPKTTSPRYSQSPGFVTKKSGFVFGYKNTSGILPIAKAGPRTSKPQKIVASGNTVPRSSQVSGYEGRGPRYVVGFKNTPGILPIAKAGPRYSKPQKTVSPASVSPRYSQVSGYEGRGPRYIVGFKKTPGMLPIAKAGPRYSKPPKLVSPSSVSPRFSEPRGIVAPASVSPRYSQVSGYEGRGPKYIVGFKKTPGLLPIAKAGPRYSKSPKLVSPSSVSPRFSQVSGYEGRGGKYVFGFKNTAGLLPIAKAGPRMSKETGFYRPGSGVDRSSSAGYAQFTLPPKEKRSNNHYNPVVSSAIPLVTVKPWQRRYRREFNEWITGWEGDHVRVGEMAQRLQDHGFALMYSEYRGFIKVPTQKAEKRLGENKAERYAGYTGDFKIKKRKGDIHPSVAYISGSKINSRKLRKEWRELNIVWVRINGNKEVAKGVKNEPDKPKYDKKEREIWAY